MEALGFGDGDPGADMNKIMMAVLQALQDEKERHEQKVAEQDPPP
jgi:hypothetical protein